MWHGPAITYPPYALHAHAHWARPRPSVRGQPGRRAETGIDSRGAAEGAVPPTPHPSTSTPASARQCRRLHPPSSALLHRSVSPEACLIGHPFRPAHHHQPPGLGKATTMPPTSSLPHSATAPPIPAQLPFFAPTHSQALPLFHPSQPPSPAASSPPRLSMALMGRAGLGA